MPLADFQQLVNALVRDDAGRIPAPDRDAAVALAVARYSRDRPRTRVEDLESEGGTALDLPGGFEAGFSRIVSLEYPIGRVPPALIRHWRLYREPEGLRLMLGIGLPAGAVVRATYTIAHELDEETDTVPPGDREAVSAWGAALLLEQLAAHHAGTADPTISADAVDHGSKSGEYARRAASLRARYFNELGLDPKKAAPAGAVVPLERPASDGGPRIRDRIFRR